MNDSPNTLLADVNLSALFFSRDGRTLTFDFLNMFDGGRRAQLVAIGVLAFNYHNTFDSDDEALPTYVAEVTCEEMQEQNIAAILSRLCYGFLGGGVETFIPRSGRFHLNIEGGELAVSVVCRDYKLLLNPKDGLNHDPIGEAGGINL